MFTDQERLAIHQLPLPTWAVNFYVYKKGVRYSRKKKPISIHTSYARALTGEGAVKAVRRGLCVTGYAYMTAKMVNANDMKITWDDWFQYLERRGKENEVERLKYYRSFLSNREQENIYIPLGG